MASTVISSGPDGLRAAAALAARGEQVRLLQRGPTASGLRDADHPIEPERFPLPASAASLARDVLGALVPASAPTRGVAREGQLCALPARRRDVAGLLPAAERSAAVKEWARARFRNELAELVGGGQEERSHRDWVVRRVGPSVWRSLYAPYAERRWGEASEHLSSVLARTTHALDADPLGVRLQEGQGASLRHAADQVLRAGGEIRTGVSVESLGLDAGAVRAVHLAGGEELPVDGALWVSAAPMRVARWLGAAAPGHLSVEAQRLPVRTALRVGLSARPTAATDLDEVHVIDSRLPIWRITWSADRTACVVHLTEPAAPEPHDPGGLVASVADELARLGLAEVELDGAWVERLEDWQPVWLRNAHATLRSFLSGLERLGLRPVGRAGAFADLNLGAEMAVLQSLLGDESSLLEVQRLVITAPARLDDLACGPERFIQR